MRINLVSTAVLMTALLAGGCETSADWIGSNPGKLDYQASQRRLADCAGQNGPQWSRLGSPPANAEKYLQHTEKVAQPQEVGREDVWYTRKAGEVLLCRRVQDSSVGSYAAFWRFREQDAEVIVVESYAWQYVVVN
jgi:hypothetical protein